MNKYYWSNIMIFNRKFSLPYLFLILFSLMFTVGISVDYDAKWSISNNTDYYIHVIVNNEPYLYVRSHGSILVETESQIVEVKAFYAPGQLISGSVTRKYTAASSDERGCEGCPVAPDSKYSISFSPVDFQ